MSDTENKTTENRPNGIHIDVETISAGGHVQFAGRDAILNVNTGGDVAQTTSNTITVGGVQTTPEARDSLVKKIEVVEQKVAEEPVDEDTKEAARHYVETIKKLLLSKKKPNPKILIDTVKSLGKLGPFVLGGLSDVFGEPLASAIIEELGPNAMQFFKLFRAKFGG